MAMEMLFQDCCVSGFAPIQVTESTASNFRGHQVSSRDWEIHGDEGGEAHARLWHLNPFPF